MRYLVTLSLFIVLIIVISVVESQHKNEEHNGLSVDEVVTTSEVFSRVYGYHLTGKIQRFVYKEPGEETSLVAVVMGEEVPIYLLRRKY